MREFAYRVKELGERRVEPSVLYKHILFRGWDCGTESAMTVVESGMTHCVRNEIQQTFCLVNLDTLCDLKVMDIVLTN